MNVNALYPCVYLFKKLIRIFYIYIFFLIFSCTSLPKKEKNNSTSSDTSKIIHTTTKVIVSKAPNINYLATKNITFYSSEQGLSSSEIKDIKEDKYGNIWFVTNKGINKYNGQTYTQYLTEYEIWSLAFDNNGNLWLGTFNNGIIKFDGLNFYNYTEDDGLGDHTYRCIFKDSKGNVWFGGTNNGVDFYDGSVFKHIDLKQEQTGNSIQSFYEDKIGNIWICTFGGGLFQYSKYGTLKQFKAKSIFEGNILSTDLHVNKFHAVLENKMGEFWVGSRFNGIYLKKGDSLVPTYSTKNNNFISDQIRDIKIDQEKNLVISTPDGLAFYDYKTFHYFNSKEGLAGKSTNKLFFDSGDNLWITASLGINKFSKGAFEYRAFEGVGVNQFYSIKGIQKYKNSYWACVGPKVVELDSAYNIKSENTLDNVALYKGFTSSILNDSILWITTFGHGINRFNLITKESEYFRYFGPNKTNNYITSSCIDKNKNIWFGGLEGLIQYDGKAFKNFGTHNGLKNFEILSLEAGINNRIWIGTESGISIFDGNTFYDPIEFQGVGITSIKNSIHEDEMLIGTKFLGLWIYNYKTKKTIKYTEENGLASNSIVSLGIDSNKNIWIGTDRGLSVLRKEKYLSESKELNIFEKYGTEEGFISHSCMENALLIDGKTMLIGTEKNITICNLDQILFNYATKPKISLLDLKLFFKEINWNVVDQEKDKILFSGVEKWNNLPQNLVLPYFENHVTLSFIGIDWKYANEMKYIFKLDGADKDWGMPSTKNEITYSNLSPGKYTFHVIAINKNNFKSDEITYSFEITPPFWKTTWFITLIILLVSGLIIFYIKTREKILKEQQKMLENEVDKRTIELREQKNMVEKQNKNIRESIEYAKRIQDAILPPVETFKNTLYESFVLYKPKDIVSGDFYWLLEVDNKILLSVIDCTGHGVPGAFMSIIGNNLLDKIVKEQKVYNPATILKILNKELIQFMRQDSVNAEVKDGMNLALCMIDKEKLELEFCGSYNPMYLIRDNNFTILKGDNIPIGKSVMHENKTFTNQKIKLRQGDILYLFSDGFADQKGGPKKRKFYYSQFRTTLLENHHLPMESQKEALEQKIEEWKGSLEQTDDICIIGVRI